MVSAPRVSSPSLSSLSPLLRREGAVGGRTGLTVKPLNVSFKELRGEGHW